MSERKRGWKSLAVMRLGGLLVSLAMILPINAKADVVTDWSTVASTLMPNGPFIHHAMMHAAIYDAVNAIDGRYSVYAAVPAANPRGASQVAAAASAAYRVLLGLLPTQTTALDAALTSSLAGVPDGDAKTRGIAIGADVAAQILALRAHDGRFASVPYGFGSGPGVYQMTPPNSPSTSPATPWMAYVTPFVLTSPAQFRADGPPDLSSATYAEDFNEVKSLGSLTSTVRTAAQTDIGKFHTENPNSFWPRNLRAVTASRSLSVADSARLYAMLWVGFADAIIGCWDSKYYFNAWRPYTAIHAADTDGNPATVADDQWPPLATTPPHPEYPSGHSCGSGVVAHTLRKFFHTPRIEMTFTGTVTGTTHVYETTNDLVKEVENARIYGGMHFRTSNVDGVKLGRRVGKWMTDNYFLPVRNGHIELHHGGKDEDDDQD